MTPVAYSASVSWVRSSSLHWWPPALQLAKTYGISDDLTRDLAVKASGASAGDVAGPGAVARR